MPDRTAGNQVKLHRWQLSPNWTTQRWAEAFKIRPASPAGQTATPTDIEGPGADLGAKATLPLRTVGRYRREGASGGSGGRTQSGARLCTVRKGWRQEAVPEVLERDCVILDEGCRRLPRTETSYRQQNETRTGNETLSHSRHFSPNRLTWRCGEASTVPSPPPL